MAPLWIKVTHWTPDKPEVFCVAELLKIDPDAVVGKLIRVWIWADQQLETCNALSVTKTLLDRVACVTGFADALMKVGWLTESEGMLNFTNFERHNGKTAKNRANTAIRVEKHRVCNGDSVTDVTQLKRSQRYKNVTPALPDRDEEEDISLPIGSDSGKHELPKKPRKTFVPPTLEQVTAYANERRSTVSPQKFFDYYESTNWMRGKVKVKNWEATFRTWENNDSERSQNRTERPSTATRGGQPTLDSSLDAIARFAARHGVGSSNSASPPLCLEANVELH